MDEIVPHVGDSGALSGYGLCGAEEPMTRTLFSHPGCPYAHRTRALLTLAAAPFEIRETSLVLKDPELKRLSPTGKVPLLVEPDGAVLYESRIIAEYLGETLVFAGWSDDPVIRARQRLAAEQFDGVVVKTLYYRPIRWWPARWLSRRERTALEGELELLESLVAVTPPRSHLGLFLAPFWIRFRWLSFLIGTEARFRTRPALAAWLDEAAALPEVVATAPDRDAYVQRYRRMRQVALVTWSAAGAMAVVGTVLATGLLGG